MADWSIYVISFGDEMHKIGISIDPKNRLKELAHRNAMGEKPIGVVYTRSVSEDRARFIEHRAHCLLSDRRYPRSEYFFCYRDAAVAAVDLAIIMEREAKPRVELLNPEGPARNQPRKRYKSRGRPPEHNLTAEQQKTICGLWYDRNVPRATVIAQAEAISGKPVSESTIKRLCGHARAKPGRKK